MQDWKMVLFNDIKKRNFGYGNNTVMAITY